jgi:A/G-specific adenine glycosylase
MPSQRGNALTAWYLTHRRSLPWRDATDPYAVLVSEVMLQQTQASRVAMHYVRFLERFPTVEALAAADLLDVLEAWSGLGFNRRARRLRDAARIITAQGWPTTPQDLQRLPGVGAYTAAAVACFAFGADVVTVDTNARRVLSRWTGRYLEGADLAAVAETELCGRPRDWNQALMDLGALVCRAADPRCDVCPVEEWCRGPETYRPPRPQGRFAGSSREARGAVLRALVAEGPATAPEISAATGISRARITAAADALIADGMVMRDLAGKLVTAD